jgi:hydrogenase maturation protease
MSTKALIIGYGNVDRQDDGIAWHILARIAAKLGVTRSLDPYLTTEVETKWADLRFMLQLTPEIAESIAAYPRVCFIDACAFPLSNGMAWVNLEAQYQPSPMTHHMTPETCLAICQVLFQQQPEAALLSVAAHEFGFSRSLSADTQAIIEPAADRIIQWLFTPFPTQHEPAAEMQI